MAGRPATLRVDIIADAKGVKAGTDEAESRLSRFGKSAGRAGKVAAVGLGAAAAAAVGVAAVTVKSASDQQQAFGALESVYGKNAAQTKAWANSAAQSVGLSATEYANLSSTVGSQLQNMGKSQAESAGATDALIKKGADLAATFGGSVSDAVGAVGSLLRGEADPIERYGVSIKAADVSARMAKDGLTGLTGAALKQAQANTMLTLLTEQTSNAQGAFGRESNTLAGQQERLRAQLDNVKAAVGKGLLPILTRLATFANSTLFPWLKQGGAYLKETLGPVFARVGAYVRSDVQPVLTRLGAYVKANLSPILATMGRYVTTIVVPALAALGKFVMGTVVPVLGRTLAPVLSGMKSAFTTVATAVQRNRPQLAALGSAVLVVVGTLGKILLPLLGAVAGTGFKVLGKAISGVIGTIAGFVGAIQRAVGWVQKLFDRIDGLVRKAKGVKLPGFLGGAVAGVVGMTPGALVGPSPSYAPGGGWATAAASSTAPDLLTLSSGATAAAAPVIVDQRSFPTYLSTGDVLDGPAAARKLQAILDAQAIRLRRTPALGAAR